MKSLIMKIMVLAMMSSISTLAQAEGITESQFLLQQAMMDSNADYNKHKKKILQEDDERADTWESRKNEAIAIDIRQRAIVKKSRDVSSDTTEKE